MLHCFILLFADPLYLSQRNYKSLPWRNVSHKPHPPLSRWQDISHGNIDMWHFPYYQVFDCWQKSQTCLEVHPPILSTSLPLPYKTNVRDLPQGGGAGYLSLPPPCENYTSDLRGGAMDILGGRGEEKILNGQINASLMWKHFSILSSVRTFQVFQP